MANHYHFGSDAITGTIGGTILTLFINITSQDLTKTILLGVIGAIVSFIVSLVLKEIMKGIWKYFKK
jgi:hypothetical protein